ncbi:hypothetical protein C8R47DRAFT_1218585 [Mycena vitilis]|nr:hypothetical protein C8R47DRAFT_1218585 [Mycena vitilis]
MAPEEPRALNVAGGANGTIPGIRRHRHSDTDRPDQPGVQCSIQTGFWHLGEAQAWIANRTESPSWQNRTGSVHAWPPKGDGCKLQRGVPIWNGYCPQPTVSVSVSIHRDTAQEMTRSASPNGAIEFSYDFPVAGPSRLPTPRRTRTRSPTRPRWENASSYRDEPEIDDDADEIDYDAFGYPRVGGHGRVAPMPMQQTRNQWAVRAPSPSDLYPYACAPSAYPSQYTAYPSYPYTLALPSSYDSTTSALSACSRSLSRCSSQKDAKPAKIRKARRSVDSERPPSSFSSSPSASPASPPASLPTYDSFDSAASPSATSEDEDFEEEDGEEHAETLAPTTTKHTLRRHWAALSLRVRFGVFRAKRRMRDRVLSL